MSASRTGRSRPCVIFNPTARGERSKRTLARLQSLESACVLKPTFAAGAARHLATEAVSDGFETIVAVGGDGTVHEVLNGIADHPEGLTQTRLAVLPVGTVNVFARELAIPLNFQRAWEVVCHGNERLIDLPSMRFQTARGAEQRAFAQMAGCGLDARAVELVSWELKKRFGQLAYVVAGMKALREKPAVVRVGNGSKTYTGQLVLIGNGRLYGGPIPVFHQADLRDGLLDIVVFPIVNCFVIMRYACAYISARLVRRGAEQCFKSAEVTLESAASAPLELDGELVGSVPAVCSVRHRVLRVVVGDAGA